MKELMSEIDIMIKIRKVRKELGISQADLAYGIGVKVGLYTSMEKCRRSMELTYLIKVMEILDMGVEDICKYKES